MTFEEFRNIRYTNPSDIFNHLPYLENLARQCNHVTEFGVRTACSTSALISGCKNKVVSYDLYWSPAVKELQEMKLPCEWRFIKANTTDPSIEIEETDFLFIDTLHTYKQLNIELKLHGNKARRWIGFHDTESQGKESDDVLGAEGINRAIIEFLRANNAWKIIYDVAFNNGLCIIERKI